MILSMILSNILSILPSDFSSSSPSFQQSEESWALGHQWGISGVQPFQGGVPGGGATGAARQCGITTWINVK
jgi:hypothetical protein